MGKTIGISNTNYNQIIKFMKKFKDETGTIHSANDIIDIMIDVYKFGSTGEKHGRTIQ